MILPLSDVGLADSFEASHCPGCKGLDDEHAATDAQAQVLNVLMVAAGDVMKSMQLLMYKPEEQKMEVRARDFHSNWMTAVEVLDDDKYIGAENSYNLFTVRKNSDAAADEERGRLEVSPERHNSRECAQHTVPIEEVPCTSYLLELWGR